MAEDVKLNISGNMSKLKGQLSKADADIKKRTGQLNQLKAKIKQTEAKMAAIKSQVGGLAKGVGVGLGTAAITLVVQDAFTSTGTESSQWAGAATAVAAGAAFGGPAGAAVAALAITVSELSRWLGELAAAVAAKEAKAESQYRKMEAFDREAVAHRKMLNDALELQAKKMAEDSDKQVKAMSFNIARTMIAGRGA